MLRKLSFSQAEITRMVRVHPSTISRELRLCGVLWSFPPKTTKSKESFAATGFQSGITFTEPVCNRLLKQSVPPGRAVFRLIRSCRSPPGFMLYQATGDASLTLIGIFVAQVLVTSVGTLKTSLRINARGFEQLKKSPNFCCSQRSGQTLLNFKNHLFER